MKKIYFFLSTILFISLLVSSLNAQSLEQQRLLEEIQSGEYSTQFAQQNYPIYNPSQGVDFLLVSDDATATDFAEAQLIALGVSYNRVTSATAVSMPINDWLTYMGVLWFGTTSVGAEVDSATAYVAAGGNLLVADNDEAYFVGGRSGALYSDLFLSYIQARYSSDSGSDGLVTGMDIMSGIGMDISADPYPDDVVLTGPAATEIFRSTVTDSVSGVKSEGVTLGGLNYKTILFCWDWDSGDPDTSQVILQNALDFLTGGGGGALGDHLLISEIVVTPTAGEYIEIYNPTASAIDLTDYYLTDATFAGGGTYYYQLVEGGGGGGGFGDFYARFPTGAMIAPGEFQTISAPGSQDFLATYGMLPTYELFEDSTAPDAIPDMLEATSGSINGQGGITNSGEVMVLLKWDGLSDLVEDIDYVVWGDKVEAIDKSGVLIDGPDANTDSSMYLNDTSIPAQDSLPTGHPIDSSFTRVDFSEGTETASGGNGITGNDETSENLSVTWEIKTVSPNTGVVPVELTSFSASVNGKSVNLYWSTATELNNGGFEIQRADRNMNWKVIGFVQGNGTTTEPQSYSYTDNSTSGNGTYYYRLKQIDYNGLYQYSPSVEVVFGTPLSFELNQNYPNPFNPATTISFRLPENSDVKLSIFNALGEEINVLVNKEMQAGFHNVRFSATNLPSGVYFYTIQTDNFTETKKMMLLK